jgi:hypothetical protein
MPEPDRSQVKQPELRAWDIWRYIGAAGMVAIAMVISPDEQLSQMGFILTAFAILMWTEIKR